MIKELSYDNLNEFYKVAKEYKLDFKKYYDEDSLINNKYQKTYLYSMDNKIVGFIIIEITFEIMNIIHLFVKEKYRKNGIATLLLNHILLNQYIENYFLEVKSNNIPAINLYKKLGFIVINIRKKYYNGIDALVMKKEGIK